MMKRTLSLLLALLLAWSAAAFAAAEPPRDATIDLSAFKQYESARSVCWVQDTLYILGSKGVYQWSDGETGIFLDLSESYPYQYAQQAPEGEAEAKLWAEAIAYLFTDGDTLYGLHPYSGSLYCITAQGLQSAGQLPADLFAMRSGDIPLCRSILGVALSGQKLFLLLGTDDENDYEKTELFAVDLAAQTAALCSPAGAWGVAAGAEGKLVLYVRDEETAGLWQYDVASDAAERKLCALEEAPSGLAWYAQFPVYFAANQVRLPDASGVARTRAYLPVPYGSVETAAACSPSGLYAYPYGQYVFIRDISAEGPAEQTVLTLLGDVNPRQLIAFSVENPDIAVISAPVSTGDYLRQAAVTADAGVDLLVASAPGDFAAIKRKGFAAPLNESIELLERAKALYPTIQDAVFDGETLLAYPVNLQPQSWTVNETRWQEFGLPAYPKTYDALYEAIALWLDDNAEDNMDFTLSDIQQANPEMLASMLVKEYIVQNEASGERLTFDTPSFRALMAGMMDNAHLIAEENEQWGMPLLSAYYQGFGTSYNDRDLARMLLPPTIDAEKPQKLSASMDVLMISATSAQKKAGLRFVAYYAAHQDILTQYMLSPDLNEPVRNASYESRFETLEAELKELNDKLAAADEPAKASIRDEIAQKEGVIESVKGNAWQISAESIEVYRSVAQNLRVPYDSVYLSENESGGFAAIANVIARYCMSGLTPDQLDAFITELDRVTYMVYMEGQ